MAAMMTPRVVAANGFASIAPDDAMSEESLAPPYGDRFRTASPPSSNDTADTTHATGTGTGLGTRAGTGTGTEPTTSAAAAAAFTSAVVQDVAPLLFRVMVAPEVYHIP
jgi:hypothetical protein